MLDIQKLYPSQDGNPESRESFSNLIQTIFHQMEDMKNPNSSHLGETKDRGENFYQGIIDSERVPVQPVSNEEILHKLFDLMEGHPHSNQNYFHNFLPMPNIPSILGQFVMTLLNGNNIWDVVGPAGAEAEVKIISMMRNILGEDYANAWGYTTWGGQGAVFTGLRLALAKYDPYIKEKGVPNNLYCFSSEVAHYSLLKSVEASGIGTNNLIKVKTNDDFSMNIEDLKEKMEEVILKGGVPVYVVATLGTTDTFGVDNIEEIKEVTTYLSEKHGTFNTFIHGDSALGGFYAFFNKYDFPNNPLNFQKETLEALKSIREKMQFITLADSICFDFHKLGQTPYTSSLFLTKNEKDLYLLDLEADETPYVGNRGYGSYHTGYTLECSRSASSIPIYASLLGMGVEGYQQLLAQYINVNIEFRKLLSKSIPNMAVTNPKNLSLITTFRLYPETPYWEKEINGLSTKEDVLKTNQLNDVLFEELGSKREKFFFGDTKRICSVSVLDSNERLPIYSAKFICISPYTTTEQMEEVVNYLKDHVELIIEKEVALAV